MASIPLLATIGGFFFSLATVIFCFVCLLLVVLVLLQPAHGEGLAGAFGGGGTDTFFGTKALSYAWKLTIGLAVTYIVLAVILTKFHPPSSASSFTGSGGSSHSGGK